MKEKVLWLDLPEGTEYQRVIAAGKTRVGIAYSKEYICQRKEKAKVEIPKPKALVGGGKVYQNDDVPYWYCDIKDGRDTFMHVYMEDLTEEDLLYDSKTGEKREFSTNGQEKYKKDVLQALANKPKEGFRWIPLYEPSPTTDGSVQFVEGVKPLVGIKCLEWRKMLEEYSPENESGMCSKTTYFLLSLRWLKDGFAILRQLADDSKEIGHYYDSEDAKHEFEKTGERKFGGVCAFVGNTCKIVRDSSSASGYSLLGGSYNNDGNKDPFAEVYRIYSPSNRFNHGVGVLELKR